MLTLTQAEEGREYTVKDIKGPTDEQWDAYKNILVESCGIEKLTEVYQAAYDRYVSVQSQKEAN